MSNWGKAKQHMEEGRISVGYQILKLFTEVARRNKALKAEKEDDDDDDIESMDWGAWQLDPSTIEVGSKIGSGEFGDVCRGKMAGVGKNAGMSALVAIKTLNKSHAEKGRVTFLEEALTMTDLHHPHLVNMYGICTVQDPVLLVLELCELGSLQGYLKKGAKEGETTAMDLLTLIKQICSGMKYLEEQRIVHRDLAARNVLIEKGNAEKGVKAVAKIADLGMSIELPDEADVYQGDVNSPIPIKWAPPEAVRRGLFSSRSDVWAFGIVMYETVTFGADPYHGATNRDVIIEVCDGGVRLPCPSGMLTPIGCSKELHNLMLKCWAQSPADRPSFAMIDKQLLPTVKPWPTPRRESLNF